MVLGLGAGFAVVFIRMALRTKTDSGIAALVAREWGPVWGELASNYLTGAVVFGGVPVLLTAGRLWPTTLAFGLDPGVLAFVLLGITVALLLAGLTTVSRLTLILSSTTAVALVASGVLGLFQAPHVVWPAPTWNLPTLGPTLLILFWAVVGWEVIGNYTSQVQNPEKTIPRAGLVSLAAVTLVYLATTLTLQTLGLGSEAPTIATVLGPLFGLWAPMTAGLLAGGLCQVSVLMFMGAVTRMTAQRAREGAMPRWLAEKTEGQTPRKAILTLGAIAAGLLTLVAWGITTLEALVSIANLFFLGNALLGLAAAWKILPGAVWKGLLVVLAAALGLLLTQGLPLGWVLVAVVTAATFAQAFFKARAAKS